MMIGVIGFVFFQVQRKTEEDQNCLPSFYRRFTKGDI
jgi:UMF1 family MFS transporter